MHTLSPSRFLRYALFADAVASGATSLLLLAGAGFLTTLFNLPTDLLRGAGAVLVPYVAFVAFVATRDRMLAALVWVVIVSNAAWAMASLLLAISGAVRPSTLGIAFVVRRDLQWAASASCNMSV